MKLLMLHIIIDTANEVKDERDHCDDPRLLFPPISTPSLLFQRTTKVYCVISPKVLCLKAIQLATRLY